MILWSYYFLYDTISNIVYDSFVFMLFYVGARKRLWRSLMFLVHTAHTILIFIKYNITIILF